MSVASDEEILKKLEEEKNDIRDIIKKYSEILNQKSHKWQSVFDRQCYKASKLFRDYIDKNQQNLYFDYNTKEYIFIINLTSFKPTTNDINKKYETKYLVFKYKDVVDIEFYQYNTFSTYFKKQQFFRTLIKKPNHHKIQSVKHSKFFRDFKFSINEYIKENYHQIQNIFNSNEKIVKDSFQLILKDYFNKVVENLKNNGYYGFKY